MRSHFRTCLERREIVPFPANQRRFSGRSKPSWGAHTTVHVHCSVVGHRNFLTASQSILIFATTIRLFAVNVRFGSTGLVLTFRKKFLTKKLLNGTVPAATFPINHESVLFKSFIRVAFIVIN